MTKKQMIAFYMAAAVWWSWPPPFVDHLLRGHGLNTRHHSVPECARIVFGQPNPIPTDDTAIDADLQRIFDAL